MKDILTRMQRRDVLKFYKQGMSQMKLALFFEVSISTIKRVIAGTHATPSDKRADMMEAMLGGVERTDGNVDFRHPNGLPDSQIDWCTPEANAIAEEEVMIRWRKEMENG